jgi:hypothetical protein
MSAAGTTDRIYLPLVHKIERKQAVLVATFSSNDFVLSSRWFQADNHSATVWVRF